MSIDSPRIAVDADAVIGRNLRTIRLSKDIGQEALGRAAGITFQQIQKYEKGTNRIPASRLVDFARVLDCSIDDFFDGLKSQSTLQKFTSFSDVKILHAYHAIASGKQRTALLRLAQSMAETDQIGNQS